LLLPMVAPDVGGTLGGLIGTAMLAILAGPVILWRMRAAVKKSDRNYTTDVVAAGWRLKLGVVTVLALGLSSSGVMAGKCTSPSALRDTRGLSFSPWRRSPQFTNSSTGLPTGLTASGASTSPANPSSSAGFRR